MSLLPQRSNRFHRAKSLAILESTRLVIRPAHRGMRGECPASPRRPARRGEGSDHVREAMDPRLGEHAAQVLQLPAVMYTEEEEEGDIFYRCAW